MEAENKTHGFWYILLVASIILLALAGYGGYVLYPRFNLLAVNNGLLLLAMMAGVASLFSPCSFPLLLTLLARETKSDGRLWFSAIAFTTGVALFLLLVGVALALGAGDWISAVTFTSVTGRLLRLAVGLVLISFGLWQVRGKSLSFPWLNRILETLWTKQAQLRRRQSTVSYGLYGFGYILAGFGWTGPILAGLALHALALGNETAVIISFTVTIITIILVMFLLVILIGTAQDRILQPVRKGPQQIKRLGGIILILVGVWLIVLSIWASSFAQIFPV